jgi:putative toxin-antitoxin system antitoxin component (TIGR02293 family)
MGTMGSLHSATAAERLAAQLEHPSANSIWDRALEVFGDQAKARSWMDTPRDIFGGRSPQDLVATGDAAEQRRVLEVLIRIEYGVFS